jgi:hypothetical protein
MLAQMRILSPGYQLKDKDTLVNDYQTLRNGMIAAVRELVNKPNWVPADNAQLKDNYETEVTRVRSLASTLNIRIGDITYNNIVSYYNQAEVIAIPVINQWLSNHPSEYTPETLLQFYNDADKAKRAWEAKQNEERQRRWDDATTAANAAWEAAQTAKTNADKLTSKEDAIYSTRQSEANAALTQANDALTQANAFGNTTAATTAQNAINKANEALSILNGLPGTHTPPPNEKIIDPGTPEPGITPPGEPGPTHPANQYIKLVKESDEYYRSLALVGYMQSFNSIVKSIYDASANFKKKQESTIALQNALTQATNCYSLFSSAVSLASNLDTLFGIVEIADSEDAYGQLISGLYGLSTNSIIANTIYVGQLNGLIETLETGRAAGNIAVVDLVAGDISSTFSSISDYIVSGLPGIAIGSIVSSIDGLEDLAAGWKGDFQVLIQGGIDFKKDYFEVFDIEKNKYIGYTIVTEGKKSGTPGKAGGLKGSEPLKAD